MLTKKNKYTHTHMVHMFLFIKNKLRVMQHGNTNTFNFRITYCWTLLP